MDAVYSSSTRGYDNTITWDLAIVGSIKILKARNIFESEHTLILLLKFIA